MGHDNAMFDLTGRVAVVTGATKGLGRAMAVGLAQAGASVVVTGRKQASCDEAAAQIAAETGADVMGIACHMGEWDAIPPVVDAVVARFGRIDVLVNNAGINPAHVGVVDMTKELWHKVLAVNLDGPLRLAQCVAPVMRDGGGGSIVNISSMAAYNAGAGNAAYGASKSALVNLTKVMAREWAPWKIRVNVICPGPIKSEMTAGAERTAPGFYERASAATMQKRTAETAEIVGPVLYLASDASSFVTGEDHAVAGGMVKG
jgi:NAD(P)-dependent dehydrogenase (short-subunit alcohol dehydrogenase family)